MTDLLFQASVAIVFFLVFSILFGWCSWAKSKPDTKSWWINWQQGMSTEMTGALIAVIMLGLVVGYIEKQEEKREQKTTLQREVIRAQLIYDMGSLDNATADHAVDRLRLYGFLTNKTLKDHFFLGANLQNANLNGAYLRGSLFRQANLQGADLRRANLKEVNFIEANLTDVQFENALFDSKTVLPDGSFWSPETDMARFTDSTHPNFWRSQDPLSPAHR